MNVCRHSVGAKGRRIPVGWTLNVSDTEFEDIVSALSAHDTDDEQAAKRMRSNVRAMRRAVKHLTEQGQE